MAIELCTLGEVYEIATEFSSEIASNQPIFEDLEERIIKHIQTNSQIVLSILGSRYSPSIIIANTPASIKRLTALMTTKNLYTYYAESLGAKSDSTMKELNTEIKKLMANVANGLLYDSVGDLIDSNNLVSVASIDDSDSSGIDKIYKNGTRDYGNVCRFYDKD